ncbi:DUF2341 domain-containing protein [Achromobacter pestifer]|uniref:Tol-Pal system protein TolQ n=1 Tax=Achromobacter pestifer TaxID=1353889 RepID=A0A6S6YXU2_9BURK|nr:MotA/TolQ/ExbB proton channel family protein [Achromobacter pestifer]CAB3647201.1 Tol-Pal system protein TolQ [Achromobacter pestifer]
MLRSLMCLLVLVTSIILPSVAHAAWWQPDWKYRKQISIDTTPNGGAINESVGRTPVLVRLHTGNFSFEGVADNGTDVRFVAADDKTVLNHQIESFDPLLGIATIWVDVPEVAGAARQDIWMYYGNEAAPAASNGQLTFDPNYTLIYHFGAAADAPQRDTTAYANHAQTTAGTTVDSVIGRGLQLTGGAQLMLPASPSLALPAGGAFTFSAWVRADQSAGAQLLYARRDGGNSLLIGLNQGVPFVEVNGQRTPQAQPFAAGAWQHLAVTADGSQVALYVNGRQAATLAVALPPLATAAAIGGDVAAAAPAAPVNAGAPPASGAPATAAPAPVPTAFAPFAGALDEVRLSRIARPAALILADATAQGSESRLVQYGADEEQSGFGFGGLGFLLKAVPFDAWIVLAVLAFMMVQTWIIMIVKSRRLKRLERANASFRTVFAKVGKRLELLADDNRAEAQLQDSSLWRLYSVAVNEIRVRREQGADTTSISSATIEAIRVSMDAVRTKEAQALGSRMGTLSNAIAGGPYIGLLGTVLGIMVVFLGTAMAGDVNINAIAPGMAAALLATAAGLFVAIPALFGYNRILGRNKEIGADMRVFVDEFVARLAEVHGESQAAEEAHQAAHLRSHADRRPEAAMPHSPVPAV